ncbi:MAG: rhomboid family intramembrane serine protease [Oscillospiraceae bacterium]|nr:rhomboid family intramembrane serine protease [Oscillospiraceae bacterium]
MLYIAIAQAAVGLLDLFSQGAFSGMLCFWGPDILRGQVWRLVTFVAVPSSSNPFYLLLGCYFYYWIGTMLEREWGTAKFSLFYLCGVVLSAALAMVLTLLQPQLMVLLERVGLTSISLGYYLNLSIFLVIATLYGEMQVLVFFVIPIKMKWMAIIDVVLILVDVVQYARVGAWAFALAPLASFVNYFAFTWDFWSMKLGFVRRRADPQVINFKRAKRQAEKKARETGGYLHKCAVCGMTDNDDPNMEFRYCSKCDGYYCYCANHINSHIHIHQD